MYSVAPQQFQSSISSRTISWPCTYNSTHFANTIATKTQTKEQNKVHGSGFVDADGDGFNDNAPDHDGDGIPNGLDPDYKGKGKQKHFIDMDGDGINDNIYNENQKGQKRGFGPQNKETNQPPAENQQKGKAKQRGRR